LKPSGLTIARAFPLNFHNLRGFYQAASSYRPQATQTEGLAPRPSREENLNKYQYLAAPSLAPINPGVR
jgi:hypothetical protein